MSFSFNKVKQLLLMVLLGTVTVWSNTLPGISFSGIGTLFPLRFVAVICTVIFLFTQRKFILYKNSSIFLFLMLGYGFASLLWCQDVSTGISAMVIYITSVFTVFSVFVLVKDERDIVVLCRVIVICAVIIGLMGIYESITGNYFTETKDRYSVSWVNNYFGWKYPHAIFYNTNDYATFMTAMLPVYCIAFKDLKTGGVLQYLCLLFSVFCVILTNSRLCLILNAAFFIWNLPKKQIKGVLLGLAAVVIVVYIGYRYWNYLSNSILDIINFSLGDERRIQIWANCLANIFRTWTFGVGVGNSIIANSQFCYFDTGGIFSVHNFPLEIFEEFGLFGFICFGSWLLSIFTNIRKYTDTVIGKYLMLFCVLYLFLTICSSSIRQAYYFWLILAVCLVYVKIRRDSQKVDQHE
ncbi:MAG: O-antigen ligase family protein [Clostridia bacterium]|nr:O-antigen ligase family protein [Clostridia bacterium]